MIILHFDFLREPHSAVPLYADECGSLGFVAFSTVSSVSKNTFSTRCGALQTECACLLFNCRGLIHSAALCGHSSVCGSVSSRVGLVGNKALCGQNHCGD